MPCGGLATPHTLCSISFTANNPSWPPRLFSLMSTQGNPNANLPLAKITYREGTHKMCVMCLSPETRQGGGKPPVAPCGIIEKETGPSQWSTVDRPCYLEDRGYASDLLVSAEIYRSERHLAGAACGSWRQGEEKPRDTLLPPAPAKWKVPLLKIFEIRIGIQCNFFVGGEDEASGDGKSRLQFISRWSKTGAGM